MLITLEKVWDSCLKIIQDNITEQSFKTWFEPIRPVKLEGAELTIQVPSQFFYEWLEEHYVALLKSTIQRVLGKEARLKYEIIVDNNPEYGTVVTLPTLSSGMSRNSEHPQANLMNAGLKNPRIIPGLKKTAFDSQLSEKLTFDNFISGECNQLASATGLAVARRANGSSSFNPLLIYGSTGLGKTHLVHAIGNEFKKSFPGKLVYYLTADEFMRKFVESVKNNATFDFIQFFQMIDMLIIDDIQFFAAKEKTQEVFFHIFNTLHQANKQIILTSDKLPKDMEGFEDRLLSRFRWGLHAQVTMPEFEMRVAIFERKMQEEGIEFPKEVVEYVAHHINTTVRDLEGVLSALVAQSLFVRKNVDIEIAKKLVRDIVKNVSRDITIEFIIKVVCEFFDLTPDKLKDKSRKRPYVQARQICMYLAKNYTTQSLKTIGKHFGNRDHSTVIHSCTSVENMIDTDPIVAQQVKDLKKKIDLSIS